VADVTDADFQTAVVERSHQVPVVVDLWAEWCGPCKTLGPVLEKVIADSDGAVELAKVDVDTNPAVAEAFRVQSIPAVYAMVDGKVVDGFMGAQPEAAVREFVERLVPTEEQSEVARLVAAGDETSLRAALEMEPGNEAAVVALAELLVDDGRTEAALELLARIPESAEVRRIAAAARAGDVGDDATIVAELEQLLTMVKADEAARERYVDLLELLSDEESRNTWRRKLSTALF